MSMSLNTLLSEADQIISKYASDKKKRPVADDDVFKLAAELTKTDGAPQEDWSVIEKIAWAQAITDTVNNIGHIKKLAEFEKQAAERGFPKEQISEYISKYAKENCKTTLPKILR
jgi:hypothetical protein